MGTDGKSLQETKELYKLAEAEGELLLSKKRGNALLVIDFKRLHVNFDIPEYKFDYFGKAEVGNDERVKGRPMAALFDVDNFDNQGVGKKFVWIG